MLFLASLIDAMARKALEILAAPTQAELAEATLAAAVSLREEVTKWRTVTYPAEQLFITLPQDTRSRKPAERKRKQGGLVGVLPPTVTVWLSGRIF